MLEGNEEPVDVLRIGEVVDLNVDLSLGQHCYFDREIRSSACSAKLRSYPGDMSTLQILRTDI